MKARFRLAAFLIFYFFLCFSCAGQPGWKTKDGFGPEYVLPSGGTFSGGMFFSAAWPPALRLPPGLGSIASDAEGVELTALSASFRFAYLEGLFAQIPLAGVLGGDSVHAWPQDNPSAWVQNWRSFSPRDNSWGLPNLVIALRGADSARAFVVSGAILDQYGKSGGINGENGILGYGSPRSAVFLYGGNPAQRFDLGIITAEGEGTFLPGDPPSLGFQPPPETGIFSPAPPNATPERTAAVQWAFADASQMALDRGIEVMVPDGPGRYITAQAGAWGFWGGEMAAGFYVQTFNGQTVMLVLSDSPDLPPYPRLIVPPFLQALFSARPLPGAENLTPLDIRFDRGNGFDRALARGLVRYGMPLTDPMPLPVEGTAAWREAQRFSRGWMLAPIQEGAPE